MGEQTRQRRRRGRGPIASAARPIDYRCLISPFPLARGYSDNQIADIHAAALTVLQDQQHAEMLSGLTLTQTVRPGAPVVYGWFTP